MDTLITFAIGGLITLFFVAGYLKSLKKRDARAREAAEKGKLFSEGPKRSIRTSTPTTVLAAHRALASAPKATCWR